METFTFSFKSALLARIVGRNPLVRASDRIEALLLVSVFVLALLAAPVAGSIGTAIHESRARGYVEQARDRQLVAATVLSGDAAQTPVEPRDMVATAPIRWRVGTTDHVESAEVKPDAKPGDTVDIWIDSTGARVAAPTPTWRAGLDATLIGSASWLGMTGAAWIGWIAVRLALTRSRTAGWDRDLRMLADGSGRAGTQM